MSATLDHVVPISVGGEHTRENVRCAHLRCNARRGNRVAA
jgi:5-methylcytosine-specific restriction endonuclease McrA